MPKATTFAIRRDGNRHVVNVPAVFSETGKRQRLYFKTLLEAKGEQKRRMQGQKRYGTSVSTLPADVTADASKAMKILARFDGVTLTHAARFYAETLDLRAKSITFRTLIEEFIVSLERRGRSAPYIRDVRYAGKRLDEVFGESLVCDIKTREIRDAFLRLELPPTLQKSFKRNLRAAFTYAVANGYAAENPFKGLFTDDKPSREIATLTFEEARALYEKSTESLRPYIVLATWCGIRPDETKRLEWKDIKWDRQWVEVRKSKTGKKRFVAMADNVMAMLEPYRGKSGPVVAMSANAWRLEFEAARKAAGVFDNWQEDIMRHTFASYWLAMHNDLDGLARQMGHSSTATAYQHYLDAVGKAEAIAFWKVGRTKQRRRKSA